MIYANVSEETLARLRELAAEEGEGLEEIAAELIEAGLRARYPELAEEPPPRRGRPRVRDP